MFSKLIFNIDGQDVEIHSHEVVNIAHTLMNNEPGEEIDINSPEILNAVFDDMKQLGQFAEAAEEDTLDPILFVPAYIGGMRTLKQWLFVAKYFSENHQSISLVGWWLLVAGRLVLVKNTSTYRFYVSDHGPLADIISKLQEIVSLPWLDAEYVSIIERAKTELDKLSQTPSDLHKFKLNFFKNIAEGSLEELREFHPEKTDRELLKVQEEFARRSKTSETTWGNFLKMTAYAVEILIKKYTELKKGDIPNFDEIIYEIYKEDKELAEGVIKRIVLAQLAKEINQGKHEPLFRPVESYGMADKGAPYHEFADSITKYFLSPKALSPKALAKIMRDILMGREIKSDELAFLPNLVVAWFIAEGARNRVSLLTNLMQLDMIENGIQLFNSAGQDLYSWQYSLVHPLNEEGRKSKAFRVDDMYGDKKHPFKVGGSLPMSNEDSEKDAKIEIKSGQKLSITRQKEGSLILHWLYIHIRKAFPEFSIRLVSIEEEPLDPSPKYEELSAINKKISKFKKDKAFKRRNDPNADVSREDVDIARLEAEIVNKKLREKQHILQELIEPILKLRLGSLANFYTHAKTNIVGKMIRVFNGESSYHFDEKLSETSRDSILECIVIGMQQGISTSFKSKEDIKKEVVTKLKTDKDLYFNKVQYIILEIISDILDNKILKGISYNFLLFLFENLTKIYRLYTNNKAEHGNALIKFIDEEGYEAYCENILKSDDLYREKELELLSDILNVRFDIYRDVITSRDEGVIVKKVSREPADAYYSHSFGLDVSPAIQLWLKLSGGYAPLMPTPLGIKANALHVLEYAQRQGCERRFDFNKTSLLAAISSKLHYAEEFTRDYLSIQEFLTPAGVVHLAALGRTNELKKLLNVIGLQNVTQLVEVKDWSGSTPLMHAVRGGHDEVIELLLMLGAKVNHQSQTGNTAIILAAKDLNSMLESGQTNEKDLHRKLEIISILIRSGADLDIENHEKQSAGLILGEEIHVVEASARSSARTLKNRVLNALIRLFSIPSKMTILSIFNSQTINILHELEKLEELVILKQALGDLKKIAFLKEKEINDIIIVVGNRFKVIQEQLSEGIINLYKQQRHMQQGPISLLSRRHWKENPINSPITKSKLQLQKFMGRWEEQQLQKAIYLSIQSNKKYSLNHLNLQAERYGFDCHNVASNGLCLLLAIEHQLNHLRMIQTNIPNYTYENLLTLFVDHIVNNIALYQNSILLDPNSFVDQALAYQINWASEIGDIASLVLSRALNMNIAIIPSDDSSPIIYKRSAPIATLYLGYEDLHYQSLIRNNNPNPEKNIDQLINNAEIDNEMEAATGTDAEEDEAQDYMDFGPAYTPHYSSPSNSFAMPSTANKKKEMEGKGRQVKHC